MNAAGTVVVAGLGEVGKPLYELMSEHHETVGIDLKPVAHPKNVEVLHICYPFRINDFIGESARYIDLLQPRLTVINSTVAVGTTRAIAERTGRAVVNSPIRGKHAKMLSDLRQYTKFVGAPDPDSGKRAVEHFESVGLKVRLLECPEASELAKLTETTYFGLMIAWAQEVERYCDKVGVKYEEVVSIYDEIRFFPPVRYFPGVIGGHCVMPNIEILLDFTQSDLLQAIKQSNVQKIERAASLTNPVGAA
ncbi:MAG: hypothetical protein LC130_33530 [Bryobacterales bacterium]|nr:hypothetical protein [Bryobacterales bacterium]